uniref:Putative ribonuclease H-like domain-containing protein n=1 Tax=Tanacetum cinerariifolium TaxID=118510 RepID=A0A699GUC3_TANCI|nr:putative ribonuclease H-like domain-containing protein [Tanacetum cinerariifolium]
MRPFGCPVTILNTKDHLGKFDGKVDEGFFVGYSFNSKAFRVFNSRTRIVEENLHIRFSENIPNVVGSEPDWLFNIDALTRTINYEPIIAGTQSNGFASKKAYDNADDGFQPLSDSGKKVDEDLSKRSECRDQEKDDNVNNTNNVNTANTNRVNTVGEEISNDLPFDLNMPALEDISTFNFLSDHKDDDQEADMINMDTTIQMDLKCAFLYGKIGEEVYVFQRPGFEDPYFLDKVYKVKKALYGLHQAPKAWYETLSTYLLDNGFYRGKIDKILFIRRHKGDILLVQVCVDDIIFGLTKKELCNAFEKMMYKKFQMSSMRELTFFLGLQVKQKKYGISISQDKYVAEILKKYGFTKVKNASTPMETQKHMLKDEDGEEVDVHMYRSMISLFMYLTSSRHDIMFAMCTCARYQVNLKVSHIHAVKRIFRNLQLEDAEGVDCLPNATIFEQLKLIGYNQTFNFSTYVFESMVKNLDNVNNFFMYPRETPLFPTMVVQAQEVIGEGSANPTDPHHIPTIIQPSISQPLKKQKPRKTQRKDIELPQTSGPTTNVADEAVNEEMDDSLLRAPTTASSLEAEQDSGKDASKQGRISDINADEDITLVSTHDDAEMFDTDQDLGGEVVFVAKQDENVVEKEVDVAQVQVTIAATTPKISINEVTLAQALAELKHTKLKAKAKGIVFHEPKESTTTTTPIPKPKSQDKGKAKMIKEPVKLKKKDQIQLDEEVALKLQAELQRAGTELEQESYKKQKIDDDNKKAELKQLVKIIPDEEGLALDVIPLAVMPPSVVDWKIQKERKKSYYKIIRDDGSSKIYLVFSHMLKDFDKEDVETL